MIIKKFDTGLQLTEVAQRSPQLWRFAPYRVALILAGLGCVAVAAWRFDRFGGEL